jgi:DNA processing protein
VVGPSEKLDGASYWAAIAASAQIGPAAILRLSEHIGDLETAWSASERDLVHAGLRPGQAASLARERRERDPRVEMSELHETGTRVITFDDEDFPALLREIPMPPALIYVRGELSEAVLARTVGIVGTRRLTAYGQQMTERLATDLARVGVTVVSGMAAGVDTVAHRAALEAGGKTVAVMGTGIDRIYPRENRGLAKEIEADGAVLTEFPPGTGPKREHFPQRNRIISGLSLGTVVVEAPERSGALITAGFAGDQGRQIMAVPGEVFSKASAGCHALIRDGATLVRSAEDVLEAIQALGEGLQLPLTLPPPPLPEGEEGEVLKLLSHKPLQTDELVRATGLAAGRLAMVLTMLELKGMVRDMGGGNWVVGKLFR